MSSFYELCNIVTFKLLRNVDLASSFHLSLLFCHNRVLYHGTNVTSNTEQILSKYNKIEPFNESNTSYR